MFHKMNELWAFLLMCSVRLFLSFDWNRPTMFSFLLPRLPHLVCRHLSYSDEICLWKVRLDWLIQFIDETIRRNSCCALVSSHTITGFVFLTPASVNIMTADQVCRGQPSPWQQQGPDIARWPDIRWWGQGPASSHTGITSHLSPGHSWYKISGQLSPNFLTVN